MLASPGPRTVSWGKVSLVGAECTCCVSAGSGEVYQSSTPKTRESVSLHLFNLWWTFGKEHVSSAVAEGGMVPPTRAQFKVLTTPQLAQIAAMDGKVVLESLTKKELAKLVVESFGLGELWAEQGRELEVVKLERERREEEDKEERQCQYELEKLQLVQQEKEREHTFEMEKLMLERGSWSV